MSWANPSHTAEQSDFNTLVGDSSHMHLRAIRRSGRGTSARQNSAIEAPLSLFALLT